MAISRKSFLRNGALTAMASAWALNSKAEPKIVSVNPDKKRVLRIAHLTDVHVQPESPAPHGFASALHKVAKEWEVWHSTLKNENSLEIVHCIGNHDIWGITMPHATIKGDVHYGKRWAVEELGLKNRYYSFDKAGWHFIMLDSVQPNSTFGYTAKLDDEQYEWLAADIAATPADKYIGILSHIPIIGVSVFFDGNNLKHDRVWEVHGSDMHRDALKLKNLFYKHKNVRLCLSGHIHLIDQLEYLGVKYLCNGAVSGAWWGGDNQEFPPAFATLNLYNDGSSDHELHYYKWKG
jgi:3',5'-cyclic AMP phosphodiesterase CpdA